MYLGYHFSENFVFNSEIEFEHINELSVEFAYIDWIPTENLTVRLGHVLIPMGIVNEKHEPLHFLV